MKEHAQQAASMGYVAYSSSLLGGDAAGYELTDLAVGVQDAERRIARPYLHFRHIDNLLQHPVKRQLRSEADACLQKRADVFSGIR